MRLIHFGEQRLLPRPPSEPCSSEQVHLGLKRLYYQQLAKLRPLMMTARDLVKQCKHGAKALTQTVMSVPHYGGTGFTAKELVEDVKASFFFNGKLDRGWAQPGPGARRALNRLAGRAVGQYTENSSASMVKNFRCEMRALWRLRLNVTAGGSESSKSSIPGTPTVTLSFCT
eukprot:1355512-Amphidinium_carterae.1